MKFRLKGISEFHNFIFIFFLQSGPTDPERYVFIYHLLMLAWNLQICVSLGISKELRKQRIFKEWKIECTSVNKTKKRIWFKG